MPLKQNIYSKKQSWKIYLFLFAVIIGAVSLLYTNKLVQELKTEERKKVELWYEATLELGSLDNPNADINFLVKVIQNNTTIPVILTNEKGNIISYKNLDPERANQSKFLKRQLEIMKEKYEPIVINLADNKKNYIYYKDSTILSHLTYYPYIQLGVIIIFILIAYYAFSISRKAEQNQVWIGLTKETAHQLGTPTSSMMAWIELLKLKNVDSETVFELEKDVNRLSKITERFSKIGGTPSLKEQSLNELLQDIVEYLSARFSSRVKISLDIPYDHVYVPVNRELFEWVIENLCKNAYDAIPGEGNITIKVQQGKNKLSIDVSDTGKGISKNKQKTIFKPGFTTKKTGWGLGLSLSKRIIEDYHCGKIFVLQSDNKGTTIRICLNKKTYSA